MIYQFKYDPSNLIIKYRFLFFGLKINESLALHTLTPTFKILIIHTKITIHKKFKKYTKSFKIYN